ncbi:HAD-IIB family hydrolase [Olsenella profusa]|uniref:HAD-IIB family hydrolase n=1 Tax=Olsenella profusa TaxID=138595 RepID=A0ABS2F2E7_9ACTN|nr:HAD-IIB family hydrolase [Olsenella profusa]MBM6774723.1 HAD-IIB family hydrolase [Olsenella profusa]
MPAAGAYAFFDIDGTLVYRDERHLNGVPTARVRAALEEFTAAGGTCVLCTGRPQGLVVPEVASLPFSGYVTMDGAHVELDGRVVRDVAMPEGLVRSVLREMERLDISAIFESAEVNVSLDRGENWFPHVTTVTTAAEVERVRPGLRFSKAVFHDHELEKFLSSDLLRESLVLFRLGDGMNEVTVEGIDKGAGLLAYVGALEEPPAHTYTFGDSENDLPMLAAADTGVVMGNAKPHVIERVRQLGGYVTDDVLDDGVATALEHFGLIGQ